MDKRIESSMQGEGLQNYLIDTGEDDEAGGRNLGWVLSNILTCNWYFKVWNMKDEQFHIFSFHLLFATLLVL